VKTIVNALASAGKIRNANNELPNKISSIRSKNALSGARST